MKIKLSEILEANSSRDRDERVVISHHKYTDGRFFVNIIKERLSEIDLDLNCVVTQDSVFPEYLTIFDLSLIAVILDNKKYEIIEIVKDRC